MRLSQYRNKNVAVLLAPSRGEPPPDPRDNACRRLEPLGAVALVLPGNAETRGWLPEGARPATLLIDASGVVRRIHAGQALAGAALTEFVHIWQEGKAAFEAFCSRCHGNDGALEICGDVKRLTGIGSRLTAAQIRERLRMAEISAEEVLIRGQFFKRKDIDAVIVYVGGL